MISERQAGGRPLAVIGAMEAEVEPLRAAATELCEERVGPFRWHRGILDGIPVLLAVSGTGKVNAAALTQALLTRGAVAVMVTGVAGGVEPGLQVGDLVVADDAMQHDVDVTALGYPEAQVPGEPRVWSADPELRAHLVESAREVAAAEGVQVRSGRVVSGDAFVADPQRVAYLWARFGAACVEMEGAAVAQVCARWRVPWVIVRSVSDRADHEARIDFGGFAESSARRAVAVVRGTLRRLD